MTAPAADATTGPAGGHATEWLAGAGGVQLRWFRWDAPASRATLLLVHGFGDHAGRYRDLWRILNARGITVVAYDQRGHGASPGRRGDVASFEPLLLDLDAAWERALQRPHPVFLYGHSFGGLVVMRWLQTRGARPAAVVLSAPWLATRMAVPRWKLAAARVLLRVAPGLPLPSGSDRPDFLTRDADRAAEYVADRLVHHQVSARFHAATVAAQELAQAGPWPELPTLLVVPGDDRLVDADAARAWQRRHPGVEILVREQGRHELHNDVDREQALRAIADWLERRLRAEPRIPERVQGPAR